MNKQAHFSSQLTGYVPQGNPLLDLLTSVEQHVQAHDAITALREKAQAMHKLHRKAIDVMSKEERAKLVRNLAHQYFYEGVHTERQPLSMDHLLLDVASEYWARLDDKARRETVSITRGLKRGERTEYLALLALSESHVKLLCANKT